MGDSLRDLAAIPAIWRCRATPKHGILPVGTLRWLNVY